jgi:hypothetical protein
MNIFIVAFSIAFVSSMILATAASADRMNGKGNCAGGACTSGATTWNPSGGKQWQKPAGATSKSAKKGAHSVQ